MGYDNTMPHEWNLMMDRILWLQREAEEAGDDDQIALCVDARKGDERAWNACMREIEARSGADQDRASDRTR